MRTFFARWPSPPRPVYVDAADPDTRSAVGELLEGDGGGGGGTGAGAGAGATDLSCQASCVESWAKCSGTGIPSDQIRPCCSGSDHCVEKDASFGQCRPKTQRIPAAWPSGAILTCSGALSGA